MLPRVEVFWRNSWNRADASVYADLRHATPVHTPTLLLPYNVLDVMALLAGVVAMCGALARTHTEILL